MQTSAPRRVGVVQQFGETLAVGRGVAHQHHIVTGSDRVDPAAGLIQRGCKGIGGAGHQIYDFLGRTLGQRGCGDEPMTLKRCDQLIKAQQSRTVGHPVDQRVGRLP